MATGYKILRVRKTFQCYECSRPINRGEWAIKDTNLFGVHVGEAAYFHPRCYEDNQVLPQELEEFKLAFNLAILK